MWNARPDEAQARIKISGRNIKNLRYVDDTIFTAESKEELQSLLIKVLEDSEQAGSKFYIQETKIMVSSPITLWQTDGKKKKMETVTDFIFLDSKITANIDWSHEIKRHLILRRKAMTNLGKY